jgi:hypothetical protein
MSSAGGGAFRIVKSSFNIVNCSFSNNYSYGDNYNIWGGGGAVQVEEGIVNIANCTFVRNHAAGGLGGAVYTGSYTNSATVNIFNSIFFENDDYYGNNSISGSVINLFNCNIEGGNSATANFKVNCIDADPMFVDVLVGNYSLSASSP